MAINIFQRRRNVAQCIAQKGQQTLNQIAQALGISKSSAWRHQKAQVTRQGDPVSEFGSSAAGMGYLIRVVVATLYCFGITQGVGAESLSEFFRLIELDRHLGTSPSALRAFKQRLISLIGQYGTEQTSTVEPPKTKQVILGSDETFFDVPILVLMELASGYIFFERAKQTRSFESWTEEVNSVNLPEGWTIAAMVSDGAKALVKLAIDTLQCVHLPDVFHLLRDLGQPLVSYLGRERKRLERQAKALAERQDKRRNPTQQAAYDNQRHQHHQQCHALAQWDEGYQQAMTAITTAIHPFSVETGEWQLWGELEPRLREPLGRMETLAQHLNLSKAIREIETFRTHIPSIAQGLSLWWRGVMDELNQRTQDPLIQAWVVSALLPALYWHQQAQKTRTPSLNAIYQQAAQRADDHLAAHPMSAQLQPEHDQAWRIWAQQQCTRFQRTSSAIEGRNGQLSRLHHATRGFSPELLNALTLIHNFDVRRADGTTPAERLFEQPFPSLFEWLVEHVEAIPLPRKSKKSQEPQPSPSLAFSA